MPVFLIVLFQFTARLNRPFDESKDKIKLDLRYGSNPNLTNGTAVVVDPKESFFTTYNMLHTDNMILYKLREFR